MKSTTVERLATEEYSFSRYKRGKLLNALAYVISQAENENNENVYFTTTNIGHGDRIKGIVIRNITALWGMTDKLGTDFNPEYVLRGMQEVTQDEDGYCMSVLTTHDLYSATIQDISELVYRLRNLSEVVA